MLKFVLIALAVAFLAAPVPTFAQKGPQRSCDEVCLGRCQSATNASRGFCMSRCNTSCQIRRQGKK